MFFQQDAPGLRCCMTSPDPLPLIVLLFLREVGAGAIRLVGWLRGTSIISGREQSATYAAQKNLSPRFFLYQQSDRAISGGCLCTALFRRPLPACLRRLYPACGVRVC